MKRSIHSRAGRLGTKVKKAACAAICLYAPDAEIPKTLEALVKAYDKEWPSKSKSGTKGKGKGKAKKGGKAPTPKLSIDLDGVLALIQKNGFTRKQAEKLVTEQFGNDLLALVKVS